MFPVARIAIASVFQSGGGGGGGRDGQTDSVTDDVSHNKHFFQSLFQ